MNYDKDKRIILVYKKDKDNNYLFDSVEIIYKSGFVGFISETEKFKDKDIITEVPHLISTNSNLLFEPCKAVLYTSKLGPVFDEFVYYDISDKIYTLVKKQTPDKMDSQILPILCELGKSTIFINQGGAMFYVKHTVPLKYQEQIKIIKKKLQAENELGYIDVSNTNKNIFNKNAQTGGIVGDLDMPEIYRKHSTTPPIRKVAENVGHDQTTREEQETKIDINRIISNIKDKIVGQDEAVEAVVANIYANQKIIEAGNKDLIATQKASILLDGPTGTGKTAIIKEVADKLELPMVVTSSTTYSATGYVGSTITDILSKLYEKANGNLELAQRGIVVIDEIDKLGGFSKEKELSMRKAVQQDLLAFISGGKYSIEIGGRFGSTIEFDTSNLTFICLGAFTSIRDKKIEENQPKNKTTIGFINPEEEIEKVEIEKKTYKIDAQDYIKYGLERELVGRFALLTSTKAYFKEDYRRILLESTISPLKNFIEFAKSFGVEEVIYDDEFIDRACEMAYEANFGARGLHQIISNLKNILLIDLINNKSKTITLTADMLDKVKEKNIRTY